MTIEARILDFLLTGQTLTALECHQRFGTLRLGAYICNLRKKGYNIKSERIAGKNRYGDKISWDKYQLEGMIEENMNHIPRLD